VDLNHIKSRLARLDGRAAEMARDLPDFSGGQAADIRADFLV